MQELYWLPHYIYISTSRSDKLFFTLIIDPNSRHVWENVDGLKLLLFFLVNPWKFETVNKNMKNIYLKLEVTLWWDDTRL